MLLTAHPNTSIHKTLSWWLRWELPRDVHAAQVAPDAAERASPGCE